jgi:hypothetical protein
MTKLAEMGLAVVGVAGLVLATATFAQVPQGLGAADPSQQLKTTGMTNFARESAMTSRNDNSAPLVSGTSDPSDSNGPASASATGTAAGTTTGAAANAQATGAVGATVNPNTSVNTETYAGSGSHRRDRRDSRRDRRDRKRQQATPAAAAAASVNATASAPAVAAPAAAPVAGDEHLSRIQQLVDEIKNKR